MIVARKNYHNTRFFYNICPKNYQNTRILLFALKIYKIPEFYMIFSRKMPDFYIKKIKNIFPNFSGGGTCPLPCPPPLPRLLRLWSGCCQNSCVYTSLGPAA